jgi:hypothetical protein
MNDKELLKKYPELEEVISIIREEIILHNRPANEVILDDVALRNLMHVSKRKTQQWRDEGLITYSKPTGKIFYCLSDVLQMLENAKIASTEVAVKTLLQKKGFQKRKTP